MKNHNGLKELKDLNLLDRFLFAETVEDPETLADILEIILGKDVVLRQLPQTEKEERVRLWSKQVRLDVWALDEDHSVYGSEKIHRLQKRVETIRSSEEMGVKFMNAWEERILDREEAFADGKKEGREEGREEGLEEGLEKGLEKGRKEIALKLKGKGMEVHEIAEITGISPEEAEKL